MGGIDGQALSPPSSYPCFVFPIKKEKEFSRAVSPSVFYYRGRGNQRIAGAALFADSPLSAVKG
jgi:hypothetical protein